MRTVHKYLLKPGILKLTLPEDHGILKIGERDDRPYIWIEHEELYPDMPMVQLTIAGRATGDLFAAASRGHYLDSAFLSFDVYHFYLL